MEALGINLPGLVTQLVSFLILFAILAKLLYGPIQKTLTDRTERIRESLEAADRAKEEAASSAERVEAERGGEAHVELLLYLIHGALHLLGHDDGTAEEAAAMHAKEDEVLGVLGYEPIWHGEEYG